MKANNILDFLRKQGILIALLALCIVAAMRYPIFPTYYNAYNVLLQNASIGLIAIGMTFVIITGGIDLSVGAVASLSSVVVATLSPSNNLVLMVVAPIVMGCFIGFCNGFVVAKMKIAPFIATLGMMMGIRGISLVMTGGVSVAVDQGIREQFVLFTDSAFLGLSLPTDLWLIVLAISIYVLRKRKFGRYIYAVGGNEEAARMMGLQPERIKIQVYMISGCLSAVAGVILASRLSSGQPVGCSGWEMNAIAAVAIGGTKLSGGRGGLWGTFIGVLILGVISNIINMQGSLNSWWQLIITGALLLFVVMLQTKMDKKA